MRRTKQRLREVSRLAPRQRLVRTQFTLWGSNLEHDSTEVIPTILWIVLGIYMFWLFGFLFLALDNAAIKATGIYLAIEIFRGLVGGLVPIVGAYGIGSDKIWMRWYIPLSFALLAIALAVHAEIPDGLYDWKILLATALFIVLSVLMIFSPVVRTYYRNLKTNRDEMRH